MHTGSLDHLTHSHAFLGEQHEENERRTWHVVGLTFSMMVAEITGGTQFGSLALFADGWHMSTHAAELTISAAPFHYARLHAPNPGFTFGTGKLGDLAGYTSAVVLGMIALLIAYRTAAASDRYRLWRGDRKCHSGSCGQHDQRLVATRQAPPRS
jgi:Co/Zn/Cd efflux system component